MADLCLTTRQMVSRLVAYLFGVDYDDPSVTAEQKQEAVDSLNSGLRRFLRGGYIDELESNAVHRWSFLEPVDSLTTTADQGYVDLPADFGGLAGEMVYDDADSGETPALEQSSPETIQQMWAEDTTTGRPQFYAVVPTDFEGTTGQRWRLLLAPKPDAAYTLSYRYSVIVDALADSDSQYPPGGAMVCDVILQAALAAAERASGDVAGHHEQLYQAMLREAVALDSATTDAPQIEQLSDADVGM